MKRLRLFGHALRLMLRGALHRPYEVITLTLGALAVTLLVLVVLGIKAGLERTLESAGSQDLLIVLGNGAEAEITSAFAIPEVNAITTAARMAGEAPLLISPEVYVNTRVGIGADGGDRDAGATRPGGAGAVDAPQFSPRRRPRLQSRPA